MQIDPKLIFFNAEIMQRAEASLYLYGVMKREKEKRRNFRPDVVFICFYLFRGSLLTRSLADLVKKTDFVLDSEYLITLLVIVPKYVPLLHGCSTV